MMADKNIYDMQLHETITVGYLYITRVAGGWLYGSTNEDESAQTVFVPYHNEFQDGAMGK